MIQYIYVPYKAESGKSADVLSQCLKELDMNNLYDYILVASAIVGLLSQVVGIIERLLLLASKARK
jgi:hypothetical protein